MHRLIALSAALFIAGPAGAACFPETTYDDANVEYAHSALVVAAQVAQAKDIPTPADPNVQGGTRYTLRIVERFKGKPPASLVIDSEDSSGRFPMGRGRSGP